MILVYFFGAFVAYTVWQLSFFYKPWRENLVIMRHVPGLRQFLHPHLVLSLVLPRLRWFNVGYDYSFRLKYDLFKDRQLGSICSIVSYFPTARALVLADPVAISQVAAERHSFVKPLWMYIPLRLFGRNVGVVEGEEWRRHRKIVTGPVASEAMNRLAWEEAQRVLGQCFDEWDERAAAGRGRKGDAVEESVVELTLKVAFFVICATAFSLRPPWRDDEPDAIPDGHQMSMRQALHGVLNQAMYKIAVPTWAYYIPYGPLQRKLHHVEQSFHEFGMYLHELVVSRRQLDCAAEEGGEGRKDLLGAMLQANAEEDTQGGRKLSDEEVQGNMYVFLLAGHETTAHTLGFTFALLALYPEVQSRLHSSLPTSRPVAYSDFPSLSYTQAVFMETLRLHPSVVIIPKYCIADQVISVGAKGGAKGEQGEVTQVACPAGTEVLLDAPALHYNPHYWGDDAGEFKPERFIDTETYRWPREAFIGFSQGHRACMGQKYGLVEATAIIATVIQQYEVLLLEDVDGTAPKGETFAQKRERVMAAEYVITLKPEPRAVVFRKRV